MVIGTEVSPLGQEPLAAGKMHAATIAADHVLGDCLRLIRRGRLILLSGDGALIVAQQRIDDAGNSDQQQQFGQVRTSLQGATTGSGTT